MAPSKVPVVRLALSLHTEAECQAPGGGWPASRAPPSTRSRAVREAARTELTDLL